ncbi:MAG: hypothetical protein WC807_18605 [Hyphomicrobium sp.]|jgi:hypothetical protein
MTKLAPYLIFFGLFLILLAVASCDAEEREFQPRKAGFVMLAGV